MRRRDFVIGNSALLTACSNDDIAPPRPIVKPRPRPRPTPTPTPTPTIDPVPQPVDAGPTKLAQALGNGPEQADRALIKAVQGCIESGQLCHARSLVRLGEGATAMAACARIVTEMVALSQALAAIAAASAPSLRALSGVTRDACQRCQRACLLHAKQEPSCRECADACSAALREYDRLLG